MKEGKSKGDVYPRVLIVNGEPLNSRTGMGINLISLFGGWPAERLAILFTARIDPQDGSCSHNWRLDTLSRYAKEVPLRAGDTPLIEGGRNAVESLSQMRS